MCDYQEFACDYQDLVLVESINYDTVLPIDCGSGLTAYRVELEEGITDEEYRAFIEMLYNEFYPRLGSGLES